MAKALLKGNARIEKFTNILTDLRVNQDMGNDESGDKVDADEDGVKQASCSPGWFLRIHDVTAKRVVSKQV